MTDPQDPFAAPGDQPPATPTPPNMPPPPAYGAPPPAYGAAPAYGQPTYGGATPEYATWGLRVLAALIDAVIVIFVQLVIGVISRQLGQLAGFGLEIYFAYLVGTKGQSPGKQVMRIKVVRDADGTLLGFGTAVLRYFAHLADVFSLGLGFLWPLWDKKRQTFADKIVGSVVIKA